MEGYIYDLKELKGHFSSYHKEYQTIFHFSQAYFAALFGIRKYLMY